jgi:hypothetical protein
LWFGGGLTDQSVYGVGEETKDWGGIWICGVASEHAAESLAHDPKDEIEKH